MDRTCIYNRSRYSALWLKQFVDFILAHARYNKLTYIAAALSFTTLLSIVPLLSLSFTVIKAFPAFEQLELGIKSFLFDNLLPTSSLIVQHNLEAFIAQASKLSLIGSIFLLATALMTMATIERAFNSIWGIKKARSGVSAFMLYWAVLTLTPLLVGVSILLSSYILSLKFIIDAASGAGLQNQLLFISSFFLEFMAFMLLYLIVPNCKIPIKHACIGGFIVAAAFEVTKYLFVLYISNFNSYEVLYGTLATLPVFLLWIYLSWLLILLGAEIVNALKFSHGAQNNQLDEFTTTLIWLAELWHAQKKGKSRSLKQLINASGKTQPNQVEEILATLQAGFLINQTNDGHYVLAKNLDNISLHTLSVLLPWRLPIYLQVDHEKINLKKLQRVLNQLSTEKENLLAMSVIDFF